MICSCQIDTAAREQRAPTACSSGISSLRRDLLALCGIAGLHLMLGLTATAQGVCDRTPQVRDALMENSGESDCRNVTAQFLATQVTNLFLPESGITALQEHDFTGLSSLKTLNLSRNSLSGLPEGIFNGLSALEHLHLSGNLLRELPERLFSGLSQLRTLTLYSNRLTTLPAGIFRGLNKLEELWLSNNSLHELPRGVFDDAIDTLGIGTDSVATGLNVDDYLKATLGFASTAQIGFEGASVRVRVVLDRALPVAVRVPFSVGGTAKPDDYTGLSPDPVGGLLFRAGETSREIVISVLKNEGSLRKTVVLTLGELPQIRLRRSDGTGPDAPHMKAKSLVLRWEEGSVHTVSISSPDESAGVCTRTPQVRGKIMEITRVSDCAQVTLRHLTGVTELDLSRSGITSLGEDDFVGLNALRVLWLHGNDIPELPEGVFDDVLDTLEDLRIDPHLKAAPNFQLTEQKTVSGQRVRVRVWLSRALPVAVRIPFIVGGDATEDAYEFLSPYPGDGLMFLAGERAKKIEIGLSEDVSSLGKTITLTLGELSRTGLRHSGGGIEDVPQLGSEALLNHTSERRVHIFTIAYPNEPADVCSRTPQVRDALVAEFDSVSDCADLTTAQLATLPDLFIRQSSMSTLQTHDFSGLNSLEALVLSFNALSELPEGIFGGLINLEWLDLRANALSELPEGIFRGLNSLQILQLSENPLGTLPEGVFSGVSSLKILELERNSLATLPEKVFSGLSALEELWLSNNSLTTLPEGIFQGLGSLEELNLYRNSLKELSSGTFSELRNLRVLRIHGNDLTSLPEELFSKLANLNSLKLGNNPLEELPERVFSRLNSLKDLGLYNWSLRELPNGIFDDVLDTLGGNFSSGYVLLHEPFRRFRGTQRGSLYVFDSFIADLGFSSLVQRVAEGAAVRVPVTLSRVLPVAVRVPFTVGLGDTTVRLRGLSPHPDEGVLFPAGTTSQGISFTLPIDAETQGERPLIVTLGKPAEIGLRRSRGEAPDAPLLKSETLVLRAEDRAVHTVTVSDIDPAEQEPYCLSLWEGAPCATVAALPHVFAGPLGGSIATIELVITNKDPEAADCKAALLFHRGTSPAPPVSFNGQFPDGNLLRTNVPRGGATVLTLASPDARELATGAVYLFARAPCHAGSFHVQARHLLESPSDRETVELFSVAGQSENDWLGDGDCRSLTALFGNGRNVELASVTAQPEQSAPPGTRLRFAEFDLKGNLIGSLGSLEISGQHQSTSPWSFDRPATIQMCLDVPGAGNFQLAIDAMVTTASGARVQFSTVSIPDDTGPDGGSPNP